MNNFEFIHDHFTIFLCLKHNFSTKKSSFFSVFFRAPANRNEKDGTFWPKIPKKVPPFIRMSSGSNRPQWKRWNLLTQNSQKGSIFHSRIVLFHCHFDLFRDAVLGVGIDVAAAFGFALHYALAAYCCNGRIARLVLDDSVLLELERLWSLKTMYSCIIRLWYK